MNLGSGPAKATERQVRFAYRLLELGGYSIQYVDSSYVHLSSSAIIGESVEGWLKSLTRNEISHLIDQLKYEWKLTL